MLIDDTNSDSEKSKLRDRLNDLDSRLFDFGRLRSDWIWETDAEHCIVYTSQRIFDYFGVPAQAAMGRKIEDFGTFLDENDSPTVPDFLAPFRGIMASTDPATRSQSYYRISSLPMFDVRTGNFIGIRGCMGDITTERYTESELQKSLATLELKVAERTTELQLANDRLRQEIRVHNRTRSDLIESREQFQAIAETSPVAIFLSRVSDQKIIFANNTASQILGIPVENLRNRIISDLFIDARSREVVRELVDATESVQSRQLSFKGADGALKWGQFSTQITQLGGVNVLLTAIMDVTELRNVDRQLVHAAKLATLGELSASITHEINQPLSVIGMAVEGALNAMDDEDAPDIDTARAKLIAIFNEQRRLVSISDHMRKFSRENQTDNNLFVPLQSCQYVINFATDDLGKRGIALEFETNLGREIVNGSATALEQVLLNIIANARDALGDKVTRLGDGGFKPCVKVSADADHEAREIQFTIWNNGGSIPEDALEQIFTPFFTTKGEAKGTGLGLSISKRLIHAMNGRIDAKNTDDGVIFTIHLPFTERSLVVQEDKLVRAASTAQKMPDGSPALMVIDGLRALVVDDVAAIRNEIREFLSLKGAAVTTAENGIKALEAFSKSDFDIIITDLQMPRMDGVELIREIRQENSKVPIVIITSSPELADNIGEADTGTVVLAKPFAGEKLMSSIARFRAAEY